VGLCPGNNAGTGKRKSGRIRRGNALVGPLLREFAQTARRTRRGFKAKLETLAILKGNNNPNSALGPKMLKAIYAIISTSRR
jgi:hypothetical protein